MASTPKISSQNGFFIRCFSLALLLLSFGAHLVINRPLPNPSPMLTAMNAGKNVADGAADLGRSVQSLGKNTVGGTGDVKSTVSTLSTGSNPSTLRTSLDLPGPNVKQVDDISRFSNMDPMLTRTIQPGIDTAKMTNTIQGSRSIVRLGSVLKYFGNSIYRTYYRLVAKYYRYSSNRNYNKAGNYLTASRKKGINPGRRLDKLNLYNKYRGIADQQKIKEIMTLRKTGIKIKTEK